MEIKLQASDGTERTLTLGDDSVLRYTPAPDDAAIYLSGAERVSCDPSHVVVGPGVPGGGYSIEG